MIIIHHRGTGARRAHLSMLRMVQRSSGVLRKTHFRVDPLLDARGRVERPRRLPCRVLLRVDGLVLQRLDEHVEPAREQGPQGGPDPVDPVVRVERVQDDAGAEGPRRVQTAARVVDAHQLGDEER